MMLAFFVPATQAQSIEDKLEIYFRQDVYAVEEGVGDNKRALEQLSTLFDKIAADSLATLSKIEINSWTSPEPGAAYNEVLSKRRSNSIRDYILERWQIADTLLVAKGNGIAWGKLREIVAASDMQYRDEVIDVIDNVPEETWGRINHTDRWLSLTDSRVKHLMDLRGGLPYKWLYDNVFPELRYGAQLSVFHANRLQRAHRLPHRYAHGGYPHNRAVVTARRALSRD